MSLSEEPEAEDGALGREIERVKVDRPGSPVPSCVSMKSDWSMESPMQFRGGALDTNPRSARQGDVSCDFCTDKKMRAVKYCHVCPASYCETHVRQHYTVPALQKHRLVEISGDQEPRLCQQHHRALEVFCKTDQTLICSLCSVQRHMGHDTIFKSEEQQTQDVGRAVSDLTDELENFYTGGFQEADQTEMGNLSSISESEPEPESESELEEPWREIQWGNQQKEKLLKEIRTLTPRWTKVKELRIVMVGQIKAGKSSYINTIDSALQGYLRSLALAGEEKYSFTKKFNPFRVEDCVNGKGDGFLPFVIYDITGIDGTVKHPDDYISAVKGHIKDGYKFNPKKPLSDDSPYFNKNPTMNDVAHCLVYVVAADQVSIMDDRVLKFLKQIRSNISDIDIPQVVLLTKVDASCPLVGKDLKKVYRSRYIKEQIERFSQILGIPINCILPVKNYSKKTSLNDDIDVLALTALLQILRFANGHLVNLKQWNIRNKVVKY